MKITQTMHFRKHPQFFEAVKVSGYHIALVTVIQLMFRVNTNFLDVPLIFATKKDADTSTMRQAFALYIFLLIVTFSLGDEDPFCEKCGRVRYIQSLPPENEFYTPFLDSKMPKFFVQNGSSFIEVRSRAEHEK
jgi:hypothetical protein